MRKGLFTGPLRALSVPLLATIVGLLVGMVFVYVSGLFGHGAMQVEGPAVALRAFVDAVIGEPRKFGEVLVSAIPLMLTGLSVALAFRCGLFNIGAEGQYMFGKYAAAWAGFSLTVPGGLHPAAALALGAAAGGLWGAVPGLLKAFRGVHEVINSIMMNYIALFLTGWLVRGVLKAAATPEIAESAALTQGLIPGSRLHAGLWVALAAALLVWLLLWRTAVGYEIRSVGLAPGAAEYAGISVPGNIILAMVLSGALSGLAGAVQTVGIAGRFYEPMGFEGYGFDGIAVALVGQNHPGGVVLAALLFGALSKGGLAMQGVAGVPKSVIAIVQGTVIFFVAAEGLWRFMQNRTARAEVKR